jgi:ribosome-associated toxin RatA of RatAB toxin-antitoxin module
MFSLVNDVEAYPEFLHWCSGARILRREGNVIMAEIDVRFAGVRQSFSTRNTLEEPHRIVISLLNGPFRRLDGDWTFTDSRSGGCSIELSLEFTVALTPLGFLLSRVFEEIAASQMDAFIRRARKVYG